MSTLAIDNDKESVKVACRHRKMNDIPSGDAGVICAYGDGFSARKVKQAAPFDLIIANILAAPLIEMAYIAAPCLSPKGYMLLSGILKTQATAVKQAYRAQGLKPIKMITRGDWVTIVLSR
jgi:ribosomal protein L11 methyltransferase